MKKNKKKKKKMKNFEFFHFFQKLLKNEKIIYFRKTSKSAIFSGFLQKTNN